MKENNIQYYLNVIDEIEKDQNKKQCKLDGCVKIGV